MEGEEDGGSSWSTERGSSLIERPWGEALEGVVAAVGAQEASCKGGRHFEQIPAPLERDHLRSRVREEVES